MTCSRAYGDYHVRTLAATAPLPLLLQALFIVLTCSTGLLLFADAKSCKDLGNSENFNEHCCPHDEVSQADGVTLMCSDLEVTSDTSFLGQKNKIVPRCNPEVKEETSRNQARYPEGSDCSMEYHVWLSKKWTVQGNDMGHSLPHGIDTSPKSPFRPFWKADCKGPAKSGWEKVVCKDDKIPNAIKWDDTDAKDKQEGVLSQGQKNEVGGSDRVLEELDDGTLLGEELDTEEFLNLHGGDYRQHPCPETNETKELVNAGKIPALSRSRYSTPLGYVSSTLSGYQKVCIHVLGVVCEDGEEGCTINGGRGEMNCPGGNERAFANTKERKCAACPGRKCSSLKNRWVEIKAQAGFEESADAQICTKEWNSRNANEAVSTEACGNGFLDSCRDSEVELDEDTGFVAGGSDRAKSYRPSAKYMFYCKEDCDTRQTKFFWRIVASAIPNEIDYRRNSPYYGVKNLHFDGDYLEYTGSQLFKAQWNSNGGKTGYWEKMTNDGNENLLTKVAGDRCKDRTGNDVPCENLGRFVERKTTKILEPLSEDLWYKSGNALKQIPPAALEYGNWDKFWSNDNPARCSLGDESVKDSGTCQNQGGTWLNKPTGDWFLPIHQPDAENWCEHRAEIKDYPESLMDPYSQECENDRNSPCSTFARATSRESSSASSLISNIFVLAIASFASILLC